MKKGGFSYPFDGVNEKISFGRIQNLGKKEMGDAPFAVIIPGEKMHFLEEEYFQKMEKE